nr:MAG TPA: hypothetical protein [Caudoviricetes sp.]
MLRNISASRRVGTPPQKKSEQITTTSLPPTMCRA